MCVGIADPELNTELAEAYNVTPPFTLEDFAYSNRRLLDVMFGHLSNTSFDGLSVSLCIIIAADVLRLKLATYFMKTGASDDFLGSC